MPDTAPLLDNKERTRIQSIVGYLLYCGRAVDFAMLTALNNISINQTVRTEWTAEKCNILLSYVATHPRAIIQYKASDMHLHIDTDAEYIIEGKESCSGVSLSN